MRTSEELADLVSRGPRAMLREFCRDESAATSIEYGLIASLMAVAIIASLRSLGNSSTGKWSDVANKAAGNM